MCDRARWGEVRKLEIEVLERRWFQIILQTEEGDGTEDSRRGGGT